MLQNAKKKCSNDHDVRSSSSSPLRLLNGEPDSLSACQFVSLLFSLLLLLLHFGFTRFRALCESLAREICIVCMGKLQLCVQWAVKDICNNSDSNNCGNCNNCNTLDAHRAAKNMSLSLCFCNRAS